MDVATEKFIIESHQTAELDDMKAAITLKKNEYALSTTLT